MNRPALCALMALVALSSLGARYKVVTKTDEITGARRIAMDGNEVWCRDWTQTLYLDVQRYTEKGSAASRFQLLVTFEGIDGSKWISVGKDRPSLFLTIDGDKAEMVAGGEIAREVVADRTRERAMYEVDPDFLATLAGARAVAVRLVGDAQEVSCSLTDKNLDRLWSFVSQEVGPQPPRPKKESTGRMPIG